MLSASWEAFLGVLTLSIKSVPLDLGGGLQKLAAEAWDARGYGALLWFQWSLRIFGGGDGPLWTILHHFGRK